MIPILLTATLWLLPSVYAQSSLLIAAFSGLAFVGMAGLFLRRSIQPRALLVTALMFAAVMSTQLVVLESKDNANHPIALTGKEYEMSPVQIELDGRLASGFWQGRLFSFDGATMEVEALVSDRDDSAFAIGCKVKGSARLVPNEDISRPWLLKVDSNSQEVACDQQGAASSLRSAFMKSLSGTSIESVALVAGLAIGDTSLLPDDLSESMKELSLTHLTAVSGANCAIILGLVFFLLGFVGVRRWQRVAISIASMFGYVQLVGPQPSVMRAATMTAVIVILTASGRSIKPLAALAHASSLLLLWNPFMAFSMGFALSVAATGGILIVTPWLYSKLKGRLGRPLAAMVSVSLAAQIWCAPILLQLQGGIPTYSLLANVLVEPAVTPVTVLGIVACLLSVVFAPVGSWISWLASIPAQYVVVIAEVLSEFPVSMLWWPSGLMGVTLLVAVAVAVTLFALNQKKRIAAALLVVTMLFVTGSGGAVVAKSASWPNPDWQVVNCDVGQGDALVIRSLGLVAVVDVGREPEPIDDCLNKLSVKSIDLLVLTHFDADHIGGLEGALEGRSVNTALLADFKDDRAQAEITERQVTDISDQVVRAHAGMQGVLGVFNWLVMQPEANGFGSEDSNDASIAMRWESDEFVLFTMADLGERGQMRLADLHPDWISVDSSKPVILKVSHHGSADQFPELTEYWRPTVALISCGADNGYGHPTSRTLHTLNSVDSKVFRTDLDGAISIAATGSEQGLSVATGG